MAEEENAQVRFIFQDSSGAKLGVGCLVVIGRKCLAGRKQESEPSTAELVLVNLMVSCTRALSVD